MGRFCHPQGYIQSQEVAGLSAGGATEGERASAARGRELLGASRPDKGVPCARGEAPGKTGGNRPPANSAGGLGGNCANAAGCGIAPRHLADDGRPGH